MLIQSQSTDVGVPPGVTVDFILHRNDPSKAIDSKDAGQVSYKFKITRCVLHVPIGSEIQIFPQWSSFAQLSI